MILEPPPQYVHAFPGVVVERRLTIQEIEATCGRGNMACSWPPLAPGGKCFIWVPFDADPKLRRHELAHCNGWKH